MRNVSKVTVMAILVLFTLAGWLPATSTPSDGPASPFDGGASGGTLADEDLGKAASVSLGSRASGYFTENAGQLDRGDVRFYTTGPLAVGFTDRGLLFNLHEQEMDRRPEPSDLPGRPTDLDGPGGGTARGVLVEQAFVGSNTPTPKGMDPLPHRSNFFYGNDPSGWRTDVPHYQRVVYEDVWDDIDVEYLFSPEGLKYNIHVRPGGAVEDIGFEYRGIDDLVVGADGLVARAEFGELADTKLLIFQSTEEGRSIVPGNFVPTGPSSFGFELAGDHIEDRDLVIDPVLMYSTYIGTAGDDGCEGVAVDADNGTYLTGYTNSAGFPNTTGAYCQTLWNRYDAFVLKLDVTGQQLLYSTYVGAGWNDYGEAIAVDDDGNAYVVGSTASPRFPTTSGANDTNRSGPSDAFLFKLNPNGSALVYSTLIGGNASEYAADVDLDGSGQAYVTGCTESTDFPTTKGAFCETYVFYGDAYVAKFDSKGTKLVYSTILGGVEDDYTEAIEVDADGNAYVAGWTFSDDFPVTMGAYQTKNNQLYDAFVLKLNPAGSALVWSTFLGGTMVDMSTDLAIDESGNAYVMGWTLSQDFPTTPAVFDATFNDDTDLFVAKLDATGAKLNFSTFFGGSKYERPFAIAVDAFETVYFAGYTDSLDLPITPNAYDVQHNGKYDTFVGRLSGDGKHLLYSTYLGGSEVEGTSSFAAGYGALALDGAMNVVLAGRTESDDFPTTANAYDRLFNHSWDIFLVRADMAIPMVMHSRTPLTGNTSDPFTFAAELWDNMGIQSAEVVYWDGAGEPTRRPMVNSTAAPGLYEFTDSGVPFSSPMSYYYVVTDIFGNVLKTNTTEVPLLDNTLPRFHSDLTPSTGTTGDELVFDINVTDNVAVGEVFVEYWAKDLGPLNLSLGSAPPFTTSITVPANSLEPLEYRFSSNDTSNNWASTPVRRITIIDNDAPIFIEDLSDGNATTGDAFVFKANWSDNIEVHRANVIYWFGDEGTYYSNMTMTDDEDDGTYVYENASVPLLSLDPLHYYFGALDNSSNWNRTPERTLAVVDNDPPEIVEELSDNRATTGEVFEARIEVRDNSGVRECLMCYWFDGGAPRNWTMEGIDLSAQGNGTYTYGVEITSTMTGRLHYYFVLVDIFSNEGVTEAVHLDIIDNDPPTFVEDTTGTEGVKGHDFTFEVQVEDNFDVIEVFVEVDLGLDGALNLSMERLETVWALVHTIDRQADDTMSYRFAARDGAGNWGYPEWRTVDLANLLPVVGTIPTWTVKEGVVKELDLEPYLSDGNDPTTGLTVTCEAPEITVDGPVLQALYDVWRADHTIEIRVSDGEDTVSATVPVSVIDVNDPPEVPVIVFPENGTKVKMGENVTFEVSFEDPDLVEGQDLAITWSSDISGHLGHFNTSEGVTPLVLSTLDHGKHTITVKVSDGEFDRSASVLVTVEPDVQPPGDDKVLSTGQWLVLVAVIVIVVIVVAILLQRRAGASEEP